MQTSHKVAHIINKISGKNKVRGFKAMRKNMTCREFKFEIGKTFIHEGKVKPCESGFHFCENIEDIFNYYYYDDCRIFEVEADDIIIKKGDKTVTNNLTILNEIDYNQYVDSNDFDLRACVASNGYGLGILVNDIDWRVRNMAKRQLKLIKSLTLTNIQYILLTSNDPIFMYINPNTNRSCFGFSRLGRCNVDMTNSLRPLYELGIISVLDKSFDIYLKSYDTTIKANIIKLEV